MGYVRHVPHRESLHQPDRRRARALASNRGPDEAGAAAGAALAHEVRVVHSSPGRLRVHLPRWSGKGAAHLLRQAMRLPGVRHADATILTRNVLLRYDAAATTERAL